MRTSYSDYYRHVTGEGIRDSIIRGLDAEKDKGVKHNLYAVKQMLADISEPTLELLVAITTDPTVHIPIAISQTNKQLKRIGDELRIASPETIRGAQYEQVLKDWNKLQNERVQFLRLMEAVKSRQTNVEQALKQQVKSTIVRFPSPQSAPMR